MKLPKLLNVLCSCLIFATASCQKAELQNSEIYIMIQPEIELNKSTDFTVYFKEKPEENTLKLANPIVNAKLAVDIDAENQWHISTLYIDENGKKVSYYALDNYLTPTKLGNLIIPEISATINGKVYKSKPFTVKVVDKVTINKDAILLELSTDKKSYAVNDTIRLKLHQFSKFSNVRRVPVHKRELTQEDIENALSFTIRIEDFVGNEKLEKYLMQNFNDIDFDWNPMDENKQLVHKNNAIYLKTFVFEFKMVAKKKGEFTIAPSEYNYTIFSSNDEYFDGFQRNDDGYYSINHEENNKHYFSSNKVVFKVK